MKTRFYGKKAYGEFVLSDDDLSKLLDAPAEFVGYVLARKYRSDRRMAGRWLGYKSEERIVDHVRYAVRMTAAALPRTNEDRKNFNPEVGTALVELKLHRKGLRLLERVRADVRACLEECAERVRLFKPIDPPFVEQGLECFESPFVDTLYLTSGTSTAVCKIPASAIKCVVGMAMSRLGAFMSGHKGISGYDWTNIHTFCDRLGNAVLEEIGTGDFVFTVSTRRHPDDLDDRQAAVRSLYFKLLRKWNKLNLAVYKTIAGLLESKIADVSELSKAKSRSWRRRAKKCEKACLASQS